MKAKTTVLLCAALLALAGSLNAYPASAQGDFTKPHKLVPTLSKAVYFDRSPSVRSLKKAPSTYPFSRIVKEVRPEDWPIVPATRFKGDPARQGTTRGPHPAIGGPLLTFEGLRNTFNPFLVAPPDPIGAIGPNNYVEMVNLVFAVYDRRGNLLTGPTLIGDLWQGFAIPDCTDLSGDPVVLYDKQDDRWLLSQFTTRGPTFYNCVAISQTSDPTGPYFRYAFSSGQFFPDYPKYGVWSDSYILTSRDFGPSNAYGISVYALERAAMVAGNPNARQFHFFLDSAVVPISQIGDGLLPADVDGQNAPDDGTPAPVIGTMDDNAAYGAPFDALNIYELTTTWDNGPPTSSLRLVTQLPVASFNSTFPCKAPPPASQTRSCIPQPGTTRKIDILSYRQRPTWRLAFRLGQSGVDTMVTNQSVQALPGVAGVRWYEIHRSGGLYSIFQQGTFAPNDGVNRWMGSIAMDAFGNIALGYSVSNGTNVFPGIRYTGRLAGDPLGQMTLGEGVLINGTGSQTATSRWGDYTSMNVDPNDDCTFWYVNQYYQTTSVAGWQTRIGQLQLPGCAQNGQLVRPRI
jgi:hypothetical protein